MKCFNIPPVSTFVIILVLSFLVSNTMAHTHTKEPIRLTHIATSRSSVRSSKNWFSHFCLPFHPSHCQPEQNPSTPAQPTPFMQPSSSPTPTPLVSSPPMPPPQYPPTTPSPLHAVMPPPRPAPSPPSNPTRLVFADQRLAVVYPIIQKFKSIITADPLGITKTWVGSDLCNYKGFFCDSPPDNVSAITVASIDFNGYQLTAPTLDGFLSQLPDIALFHANSNNFGGSISPSIAKLQYLYELDISNNRFSGAFPVSVIGMSSLTFLDIRFNQFSGVVPPAIFTQNLEVLFLNDNSFMSALPDNLSNSHILYLTLADNKFTGPLPSDISTVLSDLTEVVLQKNQLTGCLPYEIGLLRQATVFDVSHNQLTGPLPFSLACLENIELLNFDGNQLLGMLPDLICHLPNLANLSLADNYLTQVGPACRRLINNGVLDVRNNCIPGLPFQRSFSECSAFLAVPRFCPLTDTFKFIPCKLPHFP